MSLRDLLVISVVVLSLPMAFRRPYIGLLLFSWLAYMRPQDLCWGMARTMRFSFVAALTMFLGWFAHEAGRRRFTVIDVRTTSMILLTLIVSVSFAFAQKQTEYEVRYFLEFVKIILIALFTTGQVDTRQRLRWLLWLIALSLGFYGFKGGLFGVMSGGAAILRGPGGMLEDNNDFALALVMNVPLLYYLGRSEHNRLLSQFTFVTAGLSIVTILLTHSRGAFLALCCTLMWIAWRSGRLLRALVALGVCAVAFLLLAPESVLERMATITEGAAESSAAARVRSWAIALRMIEDNPVLGVGLRNFQAHYLEHAPSLPEEGVRTYVAHNSYLQIWAESGSIAFMIYLLLLGSVFLTCARVFRMGRLHPQMGWAMDYARMFEATTVGFMVGAVFLNRGHFDLIYHFIALVGCLALVARREFAAAPRQAATSTRRRGVAVRLRPALAGSTLPRWERRT